MKILITYYSSTGNTEKVAKSIKEGLEGKEVDLTPIENVNPSNLKAYDLVFLGSGIYASRVHKSLPDLVGSAPELPPKFVFFCTHASLTSYQDGFKLVKKALEKSNSSIVDSFDCMGDNIGIPEETRKMMLNRLPPEKRQEAEEHQNRLKGRPNAVDLENAKKFAQSLIEKLSSLSINLQL
ncbi:MAG: flavodoxin family protein [Promethearchaeota archaeon]